jgi:hypothetical protein
MGRVYVSHLNDKFYKLEGSTVLWPGCCFDFKTKATLIRVALVNVPELHITLTLSSQ